jgi:hypothetical protein
MVRAAPEGVADRVLVGQEAVRADFRRADHALAEVLNELVPYCRCRPCRCGRR